MKSISFGLVALLGSLVGCSEPTSIIRMPDGGRTDGGSGVCGNGEWQCVPGSQTARQCDGRGGFSAQLDCSAMGRSCIAGVGCGVCTPNTTRCKEGEPNTTQQCASDGSGWVDGQTCDAANGAFCRGGVCRTACSELGSSYLGCEYWPTLTTNSQLDTVFAFAVVVANPNTLPVTVRVENGTLSSARERIVNPGAVEIIRLPAIPRLMNNEASSCPSLRIAGESICYGRSGRVAAGAFHLTSSLPVAAYQFNPLEFQSGSTFSYTNDASLLMPQNVLAQQYIVAMPANERFAITDAFGVPTGENLWTGGFISIVGAQAEGINTVTVRLTASVNDPSNPTAVLRAGEHTFQVDRGEVVQLVAAQGAGDLTGTLINASGPIAVYAGHDCARIPSQNEACDHVEEQMFPTTTWGKTYAVTPFRDRPTNVSHVVRIVAQTDDVSLSFDGIATPASCSRTLNQGQFCEFETQTPFQVTGSKPILVAQFMRSLGTNLGSVCGGPAGATDPRCVADPAMVLEVPTDQYRGEYNFLIPSTYRQNFINVTAPRGAMITLDGNMLMGTPVNVGSNLVVYYLNVPAGSHTIRAMNPVERFGLKVYGVAPYTSYAFPGGLDLAPISPPG